MAEQSPRISTPPPPALSRLGASVRRLVERLLVVDAASDGLEATLERARERVDAVSAELEAHGGASRTAGRPYYVQGPIVGGHHPLVPQIEIAHADGVTSGTVRFGVLHEGPPGCAHGGLVAFFFDQALGYHVRATGGRGMTGTLSLRYRKPTPLERTLGFRVETVEQRGRTLRARVELHRTNGEDRLLVEGEGLFIRPAAGFDRHLSAHLD